MGNPTVDPQPAASTRLARNLAEGTAAGHFRYVGLTAGGRLYAVEIGDRRREYPRPSMSAWLDGFTVGREHDPRRLPPPAGRLDEVAALLTRPSLADQCRIAIRAAMHDAAIGVVQLADRTGRNRRAVGDALRFGRSQALSMTMAEQLMAGTGRDWHVTCALPDVDVDQAEALAAPTRPEPPGLVRMRALTYADRRGLLRWVGPLDPNRAVRARAYEVHTAAADLVAVRADDLLPWLTGLADATDPDTSAVLDTITK